MADPSLTLVCDDAAFGLLLAEGAHEDSIRDRFYLDNVTHLQCVNGVCSYSEFASVALYRGDEFWVACETECGRYLPKPSKIPYRVAFISYAEFKRLRNLRAEGLDSPILDFARDLFERLPGGYTPRPRGRSERQDYVGGENADAALILPVANLCQAWPRPFRSKALAVESAIIALPLAAVAEGLANGKVTFSWSQIRSWLTPPPSNPMWIWGPGNTELELPLGVLVPAFFAIAKPTVSPEP